MNTIGAAKITVRAERGAVVTARMPIPAEQAMLGLAAGVPLISVKQPGRDEKLYNADRVEVIITR